MKILKIAPAYRELLEQNGLADFDTLMRAQLGADIETYGTRQIRRLRVGDRDFFLKRLDEAPVRTSTELYLSGKRAHSAPYREMLHVENLRKAGIPVMQVVAVGEERRLGFPRRGFILTEGVPGASLQDALPHMDAERRAQVAEALGKLLAELHCAGFFNPLRLKDVFMDPDQADPEPRLTLIDRETRRPTARRYTRARALRSLDRSAGRAGRYGRIMEPAERDRLLDAYTTRLGRRAPMTAPDLAARYGDRSF